MYAAKATQLFKKLDLDKQERIFQAAVAEFASSGYENASMNRLVRAAGISKGSLFQYFRSKGDLFDGVVHIAANRVRRVLKGVRDDSAALGFFDRMERMLRAGFAFVDDHPLLARIYFHLLQSGEAPFGSARVAALRKESEEFLAGLIRAAVDRGELRPGIDVMRVAFLVNVLFETLLRAYYTEFLGAGTGLYRGRAEELEKWVATTLDLVRSGVEEG
jgi:AcrR family transcriptional regulator